MKSALIVRLGSMGDVVHAIPAAAALRGAFPDARIDWVTDPAYLPLLDMVTVLDRRIGIDTRSIFAGGRADGRAGLVGTLGELRRARYDVVLDLQGLLKSAVLARLAGGRRTVGFPRLELREPLARLFYSTGTGAGSDPAPTGSAPTPHVIHKNLALLAALGVSDGPVRFPLRVPDSAAVDVVVGAHAPQGFVLLNPGAAWPNKRWPPARFGAVAAAVHRARGWRSVVLWGPGDERLAADVVAASAGAADVSPPTTIPEIAALAHAARVMISGDTGPLHLAAAVGTPIVGLFGPTRPERNGPWSDEDVVVSRASQCECVYERQCRRRQPCIDDIAIEEVMSAVDRRLVARG